MLVISMSMTSTQKQNVNNFYENCFMDLYAVLICEHCSQPRKLRTASVLENVRQRQQHRCQEIFNKISWQEIFLHFVENFCHHIYWNAI